MNNNSSSPRHRPFCVSLVENTAPGGRMCKVYGYDKANETLTSSTSAFLTHGRATIRTFDNVEAFTDFRANLGKDQALMMGASDFETAQIVTQAELSTVPAERRQRERIIARDRAHVVWPEGPAVAMLDLDNPDAFPQEIRPKVPTTPEGWRTLLIEWFPGLADVQMAWAPSSSSHIYLDGRELQGLRGQRFYIVFASGQGIPRFVEALHVKLVHAGFVWCTVSKSGQLLERSPFDLTVYTPEHLDFAAGPECRPPLEWRPAAPKIWNPAGTYLDTTTLPATTEADRRRVEATLEVARRAKSAEAGLRRRQWKEETARTIAARSQNPALADEVAEAALDRGILLPDFLLTDRDGQTVSVGELLADPTKHHGRRFHDPLEPDYRGDERIAAFLVNEKGEARLYSHAHGGQWWRCQAALPVIRLGLINETVDEIARALEQDPGELYRTSDVLVAVDAEGGKIQPLTPDGIAYRIQHVAKVVGRNKNGVWVPKDLPRRALLALESVIPQLAVPPLIAVVRGPYALADGTPIDRPGYDPVSQVFYAADVPYPPRVRRQGGCAHAALRQLWEPVRLFPLGTDLDRGCVLAALLGAVIRPSIPIAPGFLFSAHTAGTGKTLLAQTIGALQTGLVPPTSAFPQNEEERYKQVFAAARRGGAYLVYDNAARGSELDSAVLAHLITCPILEGRVLGESRNESWPNRLTIVLTGNNLELRGDLNRRILPVSLDAGVEHPWEREFPFHPVNYVLAHWLALRIAALELYAAWLAAGAPKAPGATGYPEWDATVRSVVWWLSVFSDIGVGFEDPLRVLQASYDADPETDALGNLLLAAHDVFGLHEFRVKDIHDIVAKVEMRMPPGGDQPPSEPPAPDREGVLFQAVHAALDEPGRQPTNGVARLGMYLAQHEGRIVRGLKFVKGGRRGGSRKWRVVRVQHGSDASGSQSPEVGDA